MSKLHERHLGMAGPTDVISFDHLDDAPDRSPNQIDADIAICHDVARDEAVKRGHDVGRELLLYALHGMLHCLGYDDLTDEGFEAMHRKEDETLDAIGVGATFGGVADSGPALDASVRDPND